VAEAENQKQKQEFDPLNPRETIRAVICYVYDKPRRNYLLIHKAKGKFGGGFWNGPGGKIEAGESAEKATKREVFEETGLRISNLEEAGTLEFYFGHGKQKPDWTAVVFITTEFQGKLKTRSEEGTLHWIGEDELPFDCMWEDDRYWLPLLVKGTKFKGVFEFTSDSKRIVSHKLES
jgi:8-oxo-dGTP pyrophosphatase MutT (NUDIX family)